MSGFTSIPNAIMRDQSLTPGTRVLFGVILSYAWGDNSCIVPKERLAKEAGISVSTFWASIKVLKERGLLEVVQTKHPAGVVNSYRPVTQGVRFSDDPPAKVSDHRTQGVQQSDTEEDEGKNTNKRESLSASARARGLDGHSVQSLCEAINQEAADAPDRKFHSLWLRGECDKVGHLLAAQTPAVRVALVEWLFDQIAAGWSKNVIAVPLAGAPLRFAREKAEASGGSPLFGGKALTPHQVEQERRLRSIRGEL